MGLKGKEAVAFVREQQEIPPDERRVQRPREAEDRQPEAEAAARANELELIRLRGEAPVNPDRNNS